MLIVNAARGGLVDEDALAEAVRSGHVGGAGIDVYVSEPTTSSPLFELPQVVVTPHLGASTEEAQDRAGTDVARSVQLALAGEFVPDAVNVQVGGVVGEEVRPGCRWCRSWARCSTRSPAGCPARSPSTWPASWPPRTSRCCSWPRCAGCSPTSSRTR